MSVWVQIDEEDPEPLASNVGWGEVCRFAKDGPLKHLCEHAWQQDLPALEKHLKGILQDDPPSNHDLLHTLENLLTLIEGVGDAKAVFVTNGMSE